MSVLLAGGRRCLVCGRTSFLTVHRSCSRRITARAATQGRQFAGRGPQQDLSAEVAAVPAKFATDVSLPRASVLPDASVALIGSVSFAASLLDKPSGTDPNVRSDPGSVPPSRTAFEAARSFH